MAVAAASFGTAAAGTPHTGRTSKKGRRDCELASPAKKPEAEAGKGACEDEETPVRGIEGKTHLRCSL